MAGVRRTIVNDRNLVGEFYSPVRKGQFPAALVLSGSDGGIGYACALARSLARDGIAALALAYFKKPPLPKKLANIPLEYFDRAIDWLKVQSDVDASRIGLLGFSKGAEASLLVASHNPAVTRVVAVSPTHVAWESLDYRSKVAMPSWTRNGEPVAFVHYDRGAKFKSIRGVYENALAAATNIAEATIPVERINGAVLLISGGRDGLWPSKAMAEQVHGRLAASGFAHRHICYEDAGHMLLPLRKFRALVWGFVLNRLFGGTRSGNAQARRSSWQYVTAALRREDAG